MADEPCFVIDGVEYPFVPMTDWRVPDFKLARDLTGLDTDDMVTFQGGKLIDIAYAAVAVAQREPLASHLAIADKFSRLRPADIEERNFATPEDAAPKDQSPAEAPANSPSETSEPSTEDSPET